MVHNKKIKTSIQCPVCEIGCEIHEGGTGRCRMYTVKDGTVTEKYPDSYLTMFPISIETMPMLHFHPMGTLLQVSTAGCNFSCDGCISEILAADVRAVAGALKKVSAEDVVKHALRENCTGITFCINDPSVSLYSFFRVAEKAAEAGLKTGCSTNGYFTERTLDELIQHIDFINIGLKGFSDSSYIECGVPSSLPVFRNIEILHRSGVHIEISAIYIKGREDELYKIADYLKELSPEIPLQVMRFVPFGDSSIDMEPTISESELLCDSLKTRLKHVYLFNSPGTTYLNSTCPSCGEKIIEREFFGPMGARTLKYRDNCKCRCGDLIPITGEINENPFHEPGFFGGYRTTRAMEMVHSILACLGVTDLSNQSKLWNEIMNRKYFESLHHDIQLPQKYPEIVSFLAEKTGTEAAAEKLNSYISEILNMVKQKTEGLIKPRVYYAMGYPLFALNAERFETNLAEAAGSFCVNKTLKREGKPGVTITPQEFRDFDPEYIFISGFLSCPVSDFYDYCITNNLDSEAVRKKQIHSLPPLWDFGTPRWVLGLLYIAKILHPEVCSFNIEDEADRFYRTFYNIPFSGSRLNRSFYRIR